MKKTYEESTFYHDLEELFDKGYDEVKYNEEYKKLVETELPNDEWLQNHFNSTAEYLAELESLDEVSNLEMLIETARFEIDVMKKCGQTGQAAWMSKLLEEVIA